MNVVIDGVTYEPQRASGEGGPGLPPGVYLNSQNGLVSYRGISINQMQLDKDFQISGSGGGANNAFSFTEGYDAMVRRLFKPLPSVAAMVLHAAIGISGEIAELLQATTRKNVIEECGDALFYLTALKHQMKTSRGQINLTKEVIESPYYEPNLANVLTNLAAVGGDLLDLAKRSWIYIDDPKKGEIKEYQIWQSLSVFEINYNFLLDMYAIDYGMLMEANMKKLGQRYASGSYSDKEANARADKVD